MIGNIPEIPFFPGIPGQVVQLPISLTMVEGQFAVPGDQGPQAQLFRVVHYLDRWTGSYAKARSTLCFLMGQAPSTEVLEQTVLGLGARTGA